METVWVKLMMRMIDFTDYKQMFEREYGGNSGRKKDIEFEGGKWFLKFPGNIREQVNDISYSSSPVSEYIGSHIYESLDIDVHETRLGICENKCVVACRDFIQPDEFPVIEFGKLKTTFVPAFLDSQGNETNGNGTDLKEILQTLDEHPLLAKYPELKERFWDMFVVDAWIGNNDRNNGNWGLIRNIEGNLRVSPVYDNGAALLPKTSDEKLERILQDENMLKNVVYSGYSCVFLLDGHRINPMKYMKELKNEQCNAAIKRIVPRMDLAKVEGFMEEIPESYKGVNILSNTAKKVYMKILEERYYQIFEPLFERVFEGNHYD